MYTKCWVKTKEMCKNLPDKLDTGFMNVGDTVGGGGKFVVTGVIDKLGLSFI